MLVKILPADASDTLSVAQAEVSKDLPQRSRGVPWLAHETELLEQLDLQSERLGVR